MKTNSKENFRPLDLYRIHFTKLVLYIQFCFIFYIKITTIKKLLLIWMLHEELKDFFSDEQALYYR